MPKGDAARKGSTRCIEYWIEKFDMNPDAARLMVSQNASIDARKKTPEQCKLSAGTLKNQIRLYGIEDGTRRWEEYIDKKRQVKIHPGNISMIEQTFCHMIELFGFRGRWGKKQLRLTEETADDKIYWNYDFTYKNKIIEFNGDYYHGLLSDEIRGGKKSEDIIEKDERKKLYAQASGYDILIILESDFRKNPILVFEKCKNFLLGELNANEIQFD